jgi:hypothetical protein
MSRDKNRKFKERPKGDNFDLEAQNVKDGARNPITSHDRNKATEGIRQGRDEAGQNINRNQRTNSSMKRQ